MNTFKKEDKIQIQILTPRGREKLKWEMVKQKILHNGELCA